MAITSKQKIANGVSVIGGIAGIVALLIVLLFHVGTPVQSSSITTGPTGPGGPAGPAGPAGTNGTNGTNGRNAYNVTYTTTIIKYTNQTVKVVCIILKVQPNSSDDDEAHDFYGSAPIMLPAFCDLVIMSTSHVAGED